MYHVYINAYIYIYIYIRICIYIHIYIYIMYSPAGEDEGRHHPVAHLEAC